MQRLGVLLNYLSNKVSFINKNNEASGNKVRLLAIYSAGSAIQANISALPEIDLPTRRSG
jgi:hypothetical protein